jgi:glyoxylate/hydroxypyruvate reductase
MPNNKLKPINLVFYSKWDSFAKWENVLLEYNIRIKEWPIAFNKKNTYTDIQGALVWDPPEDMWSCFPKLELIQSLGAGVDHILSKSYPKNIPIIKLNDPDLNDQMVEYVLMSVIYCHRNFFKYAINKNKIKWDQLPIIHKSKFNITILGYGTIAKLIIKKLCYMGFNVKVWSKKKRNPKNIEYYYGSSQFHKSIKGTSCLISLLPNTTETNKIVGLEEFNLLKKDSYFINVGRGKTVNEFELISALNNSILTGAILDVFYKEPLSINSKLWKLDNVLISPHVAGITNPTNYAAALLRSNFNALINNKNIKNKVNNTKGY